MITVLAVLAGTVLVNLADTEDQIAADLVQADLDAVRKAVRQFRKDTGYLPKTGPFGLQADDPDGGIADTAVGFSSVDAFRDWFRSPANLSQLLVAPDIRDDHPLRHLETWDPARRQGWNGPYLTGGRLGQVLLGDGLLPDGSGDPLTGSAERPVPAMADAFPHESRSAAPPFTLPDHGFAWFTLDWDGTSMTSTARRPLLLLQLDDPQRARVVSLGPSGDYAPHVVSSGALTEGPAAPGSDNVGVFLFR